MVIHTKEKPKLKVKGAPETKIKGRNVLTVQHGPKAAGTVAEKSVADGKIKLKKNSVHVTDKRKTVQTKTAADGILNCADAAIEKTERLATEVKQYHTDKAERETAGVVSMETVSPMELAKVAEHEFQYGAEAFEAHQKGTEKAMTNDKLTENVSVKSRNKR